MPGGKHILGRPKGRHVFGTARVGERGQIVIPKEARELFGIRPGDTLRVLGELHFRDIADLFGKSESWAKVTFYRAKDKLIEDMEEHHEH